MEKILRDNEEKKPLGLHSKGEEFEVEDVDIVRKYQPLEQPQAQSPQAPRQEDSYYEPLSEQQVRRPMAQPQQPRRLSRKELKQERKNWEKNPTVKKNGLTVMRKSTKYLLVFSTLFFFVLLTIGIVWFNVTFSKFLDKDFAQKTTVEGAHINITENIDARTEVNNSITVNVNNNNTIIFPEEFTEFIEDLYKDGDSDVNESS